MFNIFNNKQLDLEKVNKLFESATELPEEVYFAAIETAKTSKEKRIMLLAEFHRSFLNGGFAGAFSYYIDDAQRVISYYRKYKLTQYADIITSAYWALRQGSIARPLSYEALSEKMAPFDEEYLALCYANETNDELEIALCHEFAKSPNDYFNILSSALEG